MPEPTAVPSVDPARVPPTTSECDPSYPELCIPPGSPNLDYADVVTRRFAVYPPGLHGFDLDYDGVGCES